MNPKYGFMILIAGLVILLLSLFGIIPLSLAGWGFGIGAVLSFVGLVTTLQDL